MNKLVNGMSSLFNIAKNAAQGVDQVVTPDTQEFRLGVCNDCDKLTKTRQCAECLCFVDFKTKYKQEKCPLSKWEATL
jgi:hypothetical protein